ncbi:hypothetical protein CCP4SC76_7810002 [Gammaproteobacteria bacterium]
MGPQQFFDSCAQGRPLLLGNSKVTTEVKQGVLPNLAFDALRTYQAVSKVTFPGEGVAAFGTTNIHPLTLPQWMTGCNRVS